MKRLLLTLALILSFLSVMAADITPISNAFKGGNAGVPSPRCAGKKLRHGSRTFNQEVRGDMKVTERLKGRMLIH